MKLTIFTIAIFAALCGCSAFDLLQYRENTGLQAVEKPDGYGSIMFGAKIAVSSTPDSDMMAISGGQGERTVFYRLSKDGSLTDMNESWKTFPSDSLYNDIQMANRGTGATLQGLPMFFKNKDRWDGAVAVGEPENSSVKVFRPEKNLHTEIKPIQKVNGFGRALAGVRPDGDSQWLLVAAWNSGFEVLGNTKDEENQRAEPVSDIGPSGHLVEALAAGRFTGEDEDEADTPRRIFVAVGTAHKETAEHRVHLYFSKQGATKTYEKTACLTDPDDSGFGGAVVTGDLDGDGNDELIVGSIKKDIVYIFDVRDVAESASEDDACLSVAEGAPILMSLTPEEGEWDVACGNYCGFGNTLAVGDIATDDDGLELIVGAHEADVDGTEDAGAVYIYRNWQRDGDKLEGGELAGQVFSSSPEADQEFGHSLAVAPMAGRNELIIGAPGAGRVYVAFCTGVGKDIKRGADITKDENGNVVSTRCRL